MGKMYSGIKIVIGANIYAGGFRLFLYPNDIVPGGVSGIAMIVNRLTGFPVGTLALLLNVPIFLIAWRVWGGRFLLGSLLGMAVSSLMIDVFAYLPPLVTGNPLLGALFGGAIVGFGLGLVFSAGASTGGSDIVAKLLRLRLPYLNMGRLVLATDVVVIFAFALIFRDFESLLYAIIASFMSSKLVDGVLYGFDYAKVAYIISDRWADLSQRITEELQRGVTLLAAQGAYTGREKQVILCAVKQQQIVALKRLVRAIDPQAFFILCEAREVLGFGFGGLTED